MSSHRFYVPHNLQLQTELTLDQAVSRHIGASLRLTTGADVTLFNGQGGEYLGRILKVTRQSVTVLMDSYRDVNRESSLDIQLAMVMIRGDRMDYALQKVTELGVSRITPLYSERCEVKAIRDRIEKKLKHWQGVVISACEQCGRNIIPRVETPVTLDQHLAEVTSSLRFMLEPTGTSPLCKSAPDSISLLSGPEGGFSAREITQAAEFGYLAVQLGPRILRAETAPVIGLSLLQSRWGDLGGR